MKSGIVSIRLSRKEIDYLASAGFLNQFQLDAIGGVEWLSASKGILRLPRSASEQFRDVLTEQLAKVGFDEDYQVTPEGQLLEDLIDRFYSD